MVMVYYVGKSELLPKRTAASFDSYKIKMPLV